MDDQILRCYKKATKEAHNEHDLCARRVSNKHVVLLAFAPSLQNSQLNLHVPRDKGMLHIVFL